MFLPCDVCGDTDGTCRCGWACDRCGDKVQDDRWCKSCRERKRLCSPCWHKHLDRHDEVAR